MPSPDFEKELLSAAQFDGSVPASRFSWSFSRERLFRRCRRAFFIGCFLSQGGWDPLVHPLIRSAYMEKHTLPFRLWLTRTVQNGIAAGLRKAVILPPDSRRKAFSSGCLRFLSKNLFDLEFSLEHGEYLSDPKRPCVRECSDGQMTRFPELRRQALDSFSAAYAALMKVPWFHDILQLDVMHFRFDDDLISILFEQWPVWFSPGLVFFSGKQFNMVLCSASETVCPSGEESDTEDDLPDPACVTAALFEMHIRSKWQREPPLARLFRFGPDGADVEEIRPEPGIRTLIRNGAGEMFSLIRPDGSVRFGDFPKTPDPIRCVGCQYAGTCRLLDQWADRHC